MERLAGLSGPDAPAAWGSDVVVDVLRQLDVPYVPMNPGSSFRGLHDSIVSYGGNRAPQLAAVHDLVGPCSVHGGVRRLLRPHAAARGAAAGRSTAGQRRPID